MTSGPKPARASCVGPHLLVVDDDRVVVLVLTVTRALHANERPGEASRVRDEFLTTLSHELRTPLTSILGWSRLMLRDELEGPMRREALESIERNAAHQARLVEDLLDTLRASDARVAFPEERSGVTASLAVSLRAAR